MWSMHGDRLSDIVSKRRRSLLMSRIKSKGTGLEKSMEAILNDAGVRYERQPKLFGHPDFRVLGTKILIFCDSSFWHGRTKQNFKTNSDFWKKKISTNKKRDKLVSKKLREQDWTVLRFWDYQINSKSSNIIGTIKKIISESKPSTTVIDLFCGVGGLTHGFVKEGFDVVAGIDIDKSCKYPFEKNNNARFINKSIEEISANEILDLFGNSEIKILVGCAPCQPFSLYSKLKNKDKKWKLLYDFLSLIQKTKPDIVSMENVPQLEKHQVFLDFVKGLRDQGYFVSWYKLYSPDYGIPQKRKRLVLFASLFGEIKEQQKTLPPSKYRTVRDAIGKLEPIIGGIENKKDILHYASRLSDINIKRIKQTPEGGGWKNWNKSLLLECHKKKTGKSFKSVYGRMRWNEPSPTITTEFMTIGTGRFGHPEQNRALSIREGALLQTFPRYYEFIEPGSKWFYKDIERHVGNAVPVKLGRVIARTIKAHLAADLYGR